MNTPQNKQKEKKLNKNEKYLLVKIRKGQIMKRRLITLEEAQKRIYLVKGQANNYGDISSGKVCFPKCLIDKQIKIRMIK